jgi:hypothetical protein
MIAPPAFNPTSFAAQLAAKKRSSWSRPQPPTQAKIKIAAELCAVPESCIQSALDQNLLYFTTSREGIQAWVVTDPTRNAAVAYRLDGQPWELVSLRTRRPISGPHRVLPASISGWPVGLPQSAQAPAIAIVELGVDFICALHLNWCAAREHVIARSLFSLMSLLRSRLSKGSTTNTFASSRIPILLKKCTSSGVINSAAQAPSK